jgi:feruloyl esterase
LAKGRELVRLGHSDPGLDQVKEDAQTDERRPRWTGAGFIAGHPEKFVDFAYRAEHEMTLEAKRLIKAFYGHKPRYSYWNGCSGGGREGLLQAYRYPMIHRAVLEACDADDGLKDGLIDDPASCHVDFKDHKCANAVGLDCLTTRQVETAQAITSPATTKAGQLVFPRLEPGTELRWGRLAGGPRPANIFVDQFRYQHPGCVSLRLARSRLLSADFIASGSRERVK